MFIQRLIENGAVSIISASLVSGSVSNWMIYQGMDNNTATYPCIKVVCNNYEPMYKETNIGVGKATLEVMTVALKNNPTDAAETTTAQEFERVSDLVINPFLATNIATTLQNSTVNMRVYQVSENGLTVATAEDGWIATQKFEIVCGRTA